MRFLGHLIKIYWLAAKRLFEGRYTYHASALAFITLLGLVPLVSVIVSLISIFPISPRLVNLGRNYLIKNFIPASNNVIEHYLQGFVQQAASLSAVGILFLFISTGFLIITIENTFNEIWEAPNDTYKYTSWLMVWLTLLLTPLLIGLSVFFSSSLFSFLWLTKTATVLGIETALFTCVPLIINTMLFSVLYIIIPTIHINFRHGLYGGFIAAVLFEISKVGFTFYISRFAQYELIYGTFAAIPIFLGWLYLTWLVVLYGALVAHSHFKYYTHLSTK